MREIERLYSASGLRAEYEDERPLLEKVQGKLAVQFAERYDVSGPFAIEGMEILFRARDRFSKVDRVLEVSRPTKPRTPTREAHRAGGDALLGLRHENILQIQEAGAIAYGPAGSVRYTVTDFVEADDWRRAVQLTLERDGSPESSIRLILMTLHGVAKGLSYVHHGSFVHTDIRPSNIMVAAKGAPRIAKIRVARHLGESSEGDAEGGSSQEHSRSVSPYDYPDTNLSAGSGGAFSPVTDIYALGQSVLELLALVDSKFPDQAINDAAFRYLHLMACRMLDGRNRDPPAFFDEFACNLSPGAYDELKYKDCGEIVVDAEKEIGIALPPNQVPELDFHSRETIHGAEYRSTVLTPRLQRVLEHPLVSRLARVSQLGFNRYVFPTASHTRFDHILGTFANACAYVDAMYHDDNPLFKQLINKDDAEALLLTSLLHDLGQFPCAHDIEEVYPPLKHELFTELLLDSGTKDAHGRTLKEIIEDPNGWNVPVSYMKDILHAKMRRSGRPGPIRSRLLSTIIDGPIDADKTDYLIRDSTECRLHYGRAIDFERLMKTITVDYQPGSESFTLAVYDKGRPCAESIAFVRYLMFASVYWHHTSRSYKSMMQYAFRLYLEKNVESVQQLKTEFPEFVVTLRASPPAGSSRDSGFVANTPVRNASETDLELLDWMHARSPEGSRALQEMLSSRHLYKRLASLHFSNSPETKGKTATEWDRFQEVASDWSIRLLLSQRLQASLLSAIRKKMEVRSPSALSDERFMRFEHLMSPENLSILVDIPPVKDMGVPLRFLKENTDRRYGDDSQASALSDYSALWVGPIYDLFKSIAVVRVFCHPEVRDTIRASLDVETIMETASEELRALGR